MFTTGAFLYPVAKIVEVSTGFSITWCIILLGLLITIYTAVGGLWAVLVTDVLQFIVLTAAVFIVVPLVLDRADGFTNFIQSSPEGFFNLFSEDYSLGFMLAFGLYNFVFIGGNWAYVQRYTSVKNPAQSKKVGWLFGALYIISPLIWMLPPMIYRTMNPELTGGLSDEGAYLLVCKEVLPAGMLGLIIGAMIFATSSSVNTTLNISAGVFTNDIFRHFKPGSSDKQTIGVGRAATVVFGIITIIIALLVPRMGGIVEVVLSVAAITGGAMYLPVIWALFSKRQNDISILSTTVITLAVNSFFKFLAPGIIGLSLTRAEEMILGVGFPVLMLTAFEIYFKIKDRLDFAHIAFYRSMKTNQFEEETEEIKITNRRGIRIIGIGIVVLGLLISLLGIFADNARTIVTTMGIIVMITGAIILRQSMERKTQGEEREAESGEVRFRKAEGGSKRA